MRAEAFYAFINEREKIRVLKDSGLPAPWTEDPILRRYKFTNVKRYRDRTTQMLKEIYDDHRSYSSELQLLNCGIARYFGRWEFFHDLGFQSDFEPDYLRQFAKERMARKLPVFTGAYIITNQGLKKSKVDAVVDGFLSELWTHATRIDHEAETTQSWEAVIGYMRKNVAGFGGTGFMAKEVILDTMLTSFWSRGKPADLNDWTPVGPGARRGAARALGVDEPGNGCTEHGALQVIGQLYAERDELWHFAEDLELHDVQFQLCEFDKYERVRLGQGRPRSLYRGGQG